MVTRTRMHITLYVRAPYKLSSTFPTYKRSKSLVDILNLFTSCAKYIKWTPNEKLFQPITPSSKPHNKPSMDICNLESKHLSIVQIWDKA
jgi:hypothetical protein